jgi:hypothetical protein
VSERTRQERDTTAGKREAMNRVLPLLSLLSCLAVSCRSAAPRAQPVSSMAPALSSSPARFTDVTAAAGIRFALGHGGKSPLTIRETIGTGAAFFDYDDDGWCDLYLVGQEGTAAKGRGALYHNEGNGAFRDASAGSGLDRPAFWTGCATGDWNGDGRMDLLLTGDGCLGLYENRGEGRFLDVTARAGLPQRGWATSAAFADIDRDGRLDLFVGRYLRFGPGTPEFCTYRDVQAACPPTHYDPQFGSLYWNSGSRYVDVTRTAGMDKSHGKTLGVAFADYDADGQVDLYLANDGVPGDLFHNRGKAVPVAGSPLAPRFENVGLETGTGYNGAGGEQAGMGVDWGDINGDGRPDLLVTTFQREPTSLYRNEGGGQFVEQGEAAGIGAATVGSLGFGAKLVDLDNDTRLDLVIANGHVQDTIARIQPGVTYPQRPQLFINRGEGGVDPSTPGRGGRTHSAASRFEEVDGGPPFARPIVGRGLATADWDNDGDIDLLITDLEGAPLLLRNESPPTRAHWLQIDLVGTRSNRMGIGARISIRAGHRSWSREVTTGGSYLSASDRRAHFGLGPLTRIDHLTIRWPSGRITRIANPTLDRVLTVREE